MKRLEVEKQMVKVGLIAFVLISAAMWLLYAGYFKTVPGVERYGLYFLYTAIAVTVIGVGLWHVKSYRHTFTCSTGMMAGMTIGMLAGFLMGAIIGATNGMFAGSVYGMFIGMFMGAWSTRSCGIMSVMEGLMAGLMGGLMGAMTTVMMISDNLAIFMPILVGSITFIMGGMNLMIYQESEEHRSTIGKRDNYEMFSYVSLLFILAMLTTFVIIYGPKSALVA
jgi:LytS/YehU family sensor histidine kinase